MRDRLIKLLCTEIGCDKDGHGDCSRCEYKYSDDECYRYVSELTADFLLAEGVIVPPCKIGQEVWYLTNACDGCKSMDDWCYKGCKKPTGMTKIASGIVHKFNILGNEFNYIETYGKDEYYHDHSFRFDSIGKIVFLTEKEAEQALKGGK